MFNNLRSVSDSRCNFQFIRIFLAMGRVDRLRGDAGSVDEAVTWFWFCNVFPRSYGGRLYEQPTAQSKLQTD